jgi:hypothetical protein
MYTPKMEDETNNNKNNNGTSTTNQVLLVPEDSNKDSLEQRGQENYSEPIVTAEADDKQEKVLPTTTTAATVQKGEESYGYESNTSDEDVPLFPTEIISSSSNTQDLNIAQVANSDPIMEEMVVETVFQQAIGRFYDTEERYSNDSAKRIRVGQEFPVRSESIEDDNNDAVFGGISSKILAKEEDILCRIAFPYAEQEIKR